MFSLCLITSQVANLRVSTAVAAAAVPPSDTRMLPGECGVLLRGAMWTGLEPASEMETCLCAMEPLVRTPPMLFPLPANETTLERRCGGCVPSRGDTVGMPPACTASSRTARRLSLRVST